MDHVLNWLWQGGAVALGVLCALRALGRVRAGARYVLCWAGLFLVLALPLASLVLGAGAVAPATMASLPAAPPATLAVPDAWWTSTTLVLSLCAVWSAVFSARAAFALRTIRRARQTSEPLSPALEARLPQWQSVHASGRRARLVVSPDVRAAAVLGCGSPLIALAPAMLRRLTPADLDAVVIHEWAHVQRRDDILNVLHLAVRAAAGWHPAVWWLDRQLQLEREVACDEIAVALTGFPKRYARCLTTLASAFPARAALQPAPGALSASPLRRRVVRILAQRNLVSLRRSTGAAVAAALVLGASAAALAGVRLVGKHPAPHEASLSSAPDLPAEGGSDTWLPASARTQGRREPATTYLPWLPASAGRQPAPDARARRSAVAPAAPNRQAPALDALTASPPLLVPASRVDPILLASQPLSPLSSPDLPPEAAASWDAVADAGVALGRGSERAGVATAAFFNRFGRAIARGF